MGVVVVVLGGRRVLRGHATKESGTECAALPASLRCSACGHFIDGYYSAALRSAFSAKATKATSVAKVYAERLAAIYDEYAPDKRGAVESLVRRAKGKEHDLYVRVCEKYGVAKAPPYDGGAEEAQGADAKAEALRDALATTVETLETQQWAQSTGDDGTAVFVDFQKAMSGGSISASISMGPDVTAKMASCYAAFVADHDDLLVARLAAVKRPYDSKLHKTFCDNIGACGDPSFDDADLSEL